MKDTLLDKAKAYKPKTGRKTNITSQEIKLSLAWLKGEINIPQAQTGFGFGFASGSTVYCRLARCLLAAYKLKKIKIVK